MTQTFLIISYTSVSFVGHQAFKWTLPFGAGTSSRACSCPASLSPHLLLQGMSEESIPETGEVV